MSATIREVPQLVLILADFHSPPASQPLTLPRLPALERLLARAQRGPLAGGWREWLAGTVCDADLAALAPAGLAAAGWLEQPGTRHYWFATPVHFFAGLDSLHVHPAGLLLLDAQAQQALAADFERVFAGSGYHLHPTGRRDLLLAGPPAGAVQTTDPARWLGADPAPGLARGADSGPLRRLGAEIEMWLHEHPVNRARAAGSELPVSALWLWGGGGAPARRPTTLQQLFAEDAFVDGLCRLCGGSAQPLPAGWSQARGTATTAWVAVLPTISTRGMEAWERIEAHWLAPALADLRAGRLDGLSLIAAARRYDLTRLGLARIWRRVRPWWEGLT